MRLKKRKQTGLITYFFTLFFIIFLVFIVATSNTEETINVNNINTVKSLKSSRIVPIKSNNLIDEAEYVKIKSVEEITTSKNKKIEFTGTLTGYGPDCKGCGGKTGCSPRQDVRNGNIYYTDTKYGKIRILAADKSIPCGSIIKVSNYPYINGDFYGIVLDRGSAIKGLTMDLLYNSEQETRNLGRAYNINFQIERWGY